jgi:hypothetical protein
MTAPAAPATRQQASWSPTMRAASTLAAMWLRIVEVSEPPSETLDPVGILQIECDRRQDRKLPQNRDGRVRP